MAAPKKRLMELQMEELKATHAVGLEREDIYEKKERPKNSRDNKEELAKLYEDAAEYEQELKEFEQELEIVNNNALKDIASILTQEMQDDERNYSQELKSVLEAGWTHFVEVEQTHSQEQLDIIKASEFNDIVEKLGSEFESDMRALFVKRWENIIAIKKEHIQEEIDEIYCAGLKPDYVKKIYKQFHGIA